MYIPKSFENKNIEQLHQIIERFNFATLISHNNGEIAVTHIPVMLDRNQGQYGMLFWHVANLNSHSTEFDGSKNALVIFHGPHAYISPTWYKNAPSVPTWNYAAVHAHGIPEVINKEQLADDLTKMVSQHERMLSTNTNYIIPDDYKSKLIEHITGFRMRITRLEGKFKLGQNRSVEDQDGMLQGLRDQNSTDSITLADFISSVRNL
jgi:transcriptional regulator